MPKRADGTMRRFRRPSVFAVAKHLPGIRDRNQFATIGVILVSTIDRRLRTAARQ